MLKMKYKIISAAMVIAPILSTGVATTVNAAPGHNASTPKSGVVYKYSHGSFTARLNNLVASGVLNSYQESRILAVYNSSGSFKTGLDNLVATHVITSYQESRILAIFNYSTSGYKSSKSTPTPRIGSKTTPAPKSALKDGGRKDGNTNKGRSINKNSGHQGNTVNRTTVNKTGAANVGSHK
jgi:hypothetical protein